MRTALPLAALLWAFSPAAPAAVIDELQSALLAPGDAPFSAARGEALWLRVGPAGKNCASCHGTDLRQPGRHERTGKPIDPMAPSVNPARYGDRAKIEKWFLRNCKGTWGRTCSAREQGDLLQYLGRL